MPWRLGIALPLAVLLLATSLEAAEPACLERILPVTVKDKESKLIEGLRPEDFRGEFRKQPVEILSVDWDEGPRRIVLVLDHNGSMEVALPLVQKVAQRMIEGVPSDLSMAMLVFGKQVEGKRGFTARRPLTAPRRTIGWSK